MADLNDLFTGSAGSLLSHTADSGDTWARMPWQSAVLAPALDGSGHLVDGSGNFVDAVRASGTPASSDHDIDLYVTSVASNCNSRILGWTQSDGSGVMCMVHDNGAINIYSVDSSGALTQRATGTHTLDFNGLGATYKHTLRRSGNNFSGLVDGVVKVGPWDGSALGLGNGRPGFYFRTASIDRINIPSAGPTITSQPSNQTATAGNTATFGVTATSSGGALSYQWERSTNSGGSWANVSTGTGGTSASYTTAATTVSGGNANNGDQYRVKVTDSNGTTTSSAASLTVNAAAATGYSLTGPSSGVVGVASSNFTVTLTPAGGTSASATITPSSGGGGGTFTPSTVTLSTGTPSATFTYTPASAGVKTISTTDSLSLTDPSPITFTASSTSTKGGAILALLAGKVL